MILSTFPQPDLGIHYTPTADGLKVSFVTSDSSAQRLGLKPGDVIVSIHGYPVIDDKIWRRLLSAGGNYVRLRIRDGRTGSLQTRFADLEG